MTDKIPPAQTPAEALDETNSTENLIYSEDLKKETSNTALLKALLHEQRKTNEFLEGIRFRLTPVMILAHAGLFALAFWVFTLFLS